MSRKIFLLGLCTGIFSSAACIVYNRVYFFAFEANFSKLVNTASLAGINLAVGMIAALGYWTLKKWFRHKTDIIFNFCFTIISFAAIIVPISISLPLDMPNPELFPGLTIPMLFFPAISWFTLKPLFIRETRIVSSEL